MSAQRPSSPVLQEIRAMWQLAWPMLVGQIATVGMGVLVLAFTGSVLLVVDVTTGRAGGVAAGAATLLVCLGLWGLLPRLVLRAGHAEEHRAAQAHSHPAPRPTEREVIRPRATVRPGGSPREPSPRLR